MGTARTALTTVLLAGCLVLSALSGTAAVLDGRVDRMHVDLPGGDGTTWVIVGLDSRAHLPAGASAADFGSVSDVPGERADVILVLHSSAAGGAAFSIPRDLVASEAETPGRIALSWLDGPQSTVDALCGLGIAADHLVAVDLGGFARMVDAVDGVRVDVPVAVRDPLAGLQLPAGSRTVDGATALALVRSRHPEHVLDGRWTPAAVDPDGRASSAGTMLMALVESARSALRSPSRLAALGWAASGAVAVDDDTSPAQLLALLRSHLDPPTVLPVGEPLNGTLARFPTPATAEALSGAGMSCAQ